jgi:hypothetical protein
MGRIGQASDSCDTLRFVKLGFDYLQGHFLPALNELELDFEVGNPACPAEVSHAASFGDDFLAAFTGTINNHFLPPYLRFRFRNLAR